MCQNFASSLNVDGAVPLRWRLLAPAMSGHSGRRAVRWADIWNLLALQVEEEETPEVVKVFSDEYSAECIARTSRRRTCPKSASGSVYWNRSFMCQSRRFWKRPSHPFPFSGRNC